VHRLQVGLVEAGPEPSRLVGLERRPHVHEAVAGVDRTEDALPARGAALRRRDDEHVVRGETGEGETAVDHRGEVERGAVQGRRLDLRDDVDEGRGAQVACGERDRGALQQPGEIDVDVVADHGEQRGALLRLDPGQAGDGHGSSSVGGSRRA
jgi:hypothetical protein